MVTRLTRLVAVTIIVGRSVVVAAAAAGQQASTGSACSAVVDEHEAPLSVDVTWVKRVGTRERERLDEQCETVGPVVVRKSPTASS